MQERGFEVHDLDLIVVVPSDVGVYVNERRDVAIDESNYDVPLLLIPR